MTPSGDAIPISLSLLELRGIGICDLALSCWALPARRTPGRVWAWQPILPRERAAGSEIDLETEAGDEARGGVGTRVADVLEVEGERGASADGDVVEALAGGLGAMPDRVAGGAADPAAGDPNADYVAAPRGDEPLVAEAAATEVLDLAVAIGRVAVAAEDAEALTVVGVAGLLADHLVEADLEARLALLVLAGAQVLEPQGVVPEAHARGAGQRPLAAGRDADLDAGLGDDEPVAVGLQRSPVLSASPLAPKNEPT